MIIILLMKPLINIPVWDTGINHTVQWGENGDAIISVCIKY